MSKGIFLQLGSNIENKSENLHNARLLIKQKIGQIAAESSVYETKAWGVEHQPDFLNQVIEIKSDAHPKDVLESCLIIENQMGRIRNEKWGPRNIDIDLLFYHDEILTIPGLVLPHPRICERMFVLEPLCEIAPYFIHPVENVSCTDLMRICT